MTTSAWGWLRQILRDGLKLRLLPGRDEGAAGRELQHGGDRRRGLGLAALFLLQLGDPVAQGIQDAVEGGLGLAALLGRLVRHLVRPVADIDIGRAVARQAGELAAGGIGGLGEPRRLVAVIDQRAHVAVEGLLHIGLDDGRLLLVIGRRLAARDQRKEDTGKRKMRQAAHGRTPPGLPIACLRSAALRIGSGPGEGPGRYSQAPTPGRAARPPHRPRAPAARRR